MIQWTLAIELRGSLLVYATLTIAAAFTPYHRSLVVFTLLAYSVWCGDLLGEVPFYTGALLADLSIMLPNESLSISKSRWPIGLAILALFLSSYPTDNAHLAQWSQVMARIGLAVFPDECTCPGYAF